MAYQEMLKLAAKAAGMKLYEPHYMDALMVERVTERCAAVVPWRPLTDDGDALRLAVDLRMCVRCYEGSIIVDGGGASVEIHDVSDRAAATRLAIVRVAALMGAGA